MVRCRNCLVERDSSTGAHGWDDSNLVTIPDDDGGRSLRRVMVVVFFDIHVVEVDGNSAAAENLVLNTGIPSLQFFKKLRKT